MNTKLSPKEAASIIAQHEARRFMTFDDVDEYGRDQVIEISYEDLIAYGTDMFNAGTKEWTIEEV
ncbi:MAG: hypothetical protein K6B42_03135 [Clostridia bacterium]|nr:hypothetical protein [Clostridia bacterium]